MSVPAPRGCGLRTLDLKGDERGSLISIEGSRDVPFPIQRVYYIFGTQLNVSRGFHAHVDLTQLAVCVSGSCVMALDDGSVRQEFTLDRPDTALLIGPMIWREMHQFSPDCVLLVLASRWYDEADYIRNYEDFKDKVAALR